MPVASKIAAMIPIVFGIFVLHYGNNQREESGHQQYSYYGVFKLFPDKSFHKEDGRFRRRQQVYTMLGTALPYFIVSKSDVIKSSFVAVMQFVRFKLNCKKYNNNLYRECY